MCRSAHISPATPLLHIYDLLYHTVFSFSSPMNAPTNNPKISYKKRSGNLVLRFANCLPDLNFQFSIFNQAKTADCFAIDCLIIGLYINYHLASSSALVALFFFLATYLEYLESFLSRRKNTKAIAPRITATSTNQRPTFADL